MNYFKLCFLISALTVVFISCKKDETIKEIEKCDCEGEVYGTFTDLKATHVSNNYFEIHKEYAFPARRCVVDTAEVLPPGNYLVSGGFKQRCSGEDVNLRTNLSLIPLVEFSSIEKVD